MANNGVKKFICTFENGLKAIMGATSKEDAMEAAAMMQNTARSKIVDIEEIKEETSELEGYFEQTFNEPQLPDEIEVEEETGIDF